MSNYTEDFLTGVQTIQDRLDKIVEIVETAPKHSNPDRRDQVIELLTTAVKLASSELKLCHRWVTSEHCLERALEEALSKKP